jgi:hypothetical protein
LAAAVPDVQISAAGKPDFWAIPNAKKLAERSSSMGIVSILLFWAKAIVNGADREPGQITAVVNPSRCNVSANTEAQTCLYCENLLALLKLSSSTLYCATILYPNNCQDTFL